MKHFLYGFALMWGLQSATHLSAHLLAVFFGWADAQFLINTPMRAEAIFHVLAGASVFYGVFWYGLHRLKEYALKKARGRLG